jgi:hypothetical protein
LTPPAEQFVKGTGAKLTYDSPRHRPLVNAQIPGQSALRGLDETPRSVGGPANRHNHHQRRGTVAGLAGRHRANTQVSRQVKAYQELVALLDFFKGWTVVPFDDDAATRFKPVRGEGVRIGSMDLKIASIALSHAGLVLTANIQHFRRVPGLRVENWLD